MTLSKSLSLRLLLLAACAFLLFIRLGHYPLWDDEACTALLAKGVWRTGDSLALTPEHNLMAFNAGHSLEGLHDRLQPPLQLYLLAPFVGPFQNTAFIARLPTALLSLGFIAFLFHCMARFRATRRQWLIFSLLLLTNVPLFLFLRQARYYPLAIFSVSLSIYLYLTLGPNPRVRDVLKLGLSLSLLPLIAPQSFLSIAPAFLLDYLLFGRRVSRFSPGGWLALLTPSLLTSIFLLFTWNPLHGIKPDSYPLDLSERLTLVWQTFRDFNLTQMGVGSLLVAAPLIALASKRPLLLRGPLALTLVLTIEALIDPTREIPQLRHLAPLIPLAMFLALAVLDLAFSYSRYLGAILLLLSTFTNILHWGALHPSTRLRSLPYLWAVELISPPPDPYTSAIAWIKANLTPGATVAVTPDYMRYPLMYHAPHALYTWQLSPTERPHISPTIDPRQYQDLTLSQTPPDYLISFGYRSEFITTFESQTHAHYTIVQTLPTYWRDMYRPEITMRTFTPITQYRTAESIFILKRDTLPRSE